MYNREKKGSGEGVARAAEERKWGEIQLDTNPEENRKEKKKRETVSWAQGQTYTGREGESTQRYGFVVRQRKTQWT